MAFSIVKPLLVLCLQHMVQTCVQGRHELDGLSKLLHYDSDPGSKLQHDDRDPVRTRPFVPDHGAEIQKLASSSTGHEGRRLESVEIQAHMKSEMPVDHVEVRCQALQKGVLVKDFYYVVLKPGEDHLWSVEQIDLSPDRIICIMFWKKLYLIYDIYYYVDNGQLISEWVIDETGLNLGDGSGSYLVQTWREPKP